jgi:hypothetical protein
MKIKIMPIDNPKVEGAKAKYVICARVEDVPTPIVDATIGKPQRGVCSECGTPIWYSKRSPEGPPKVCMPCAARMYTPDDDAVFMVNRKHLQ